MKKPNGCSRSGKLSGLHFVAAMLHRLYFEEIASSKSHERRCNRITCSGRHIRHNCRPRAHNGAFMSNRPRMRRQRSVDIDPHAIIERVQRWWETCIVYNVRGTRHRFLWLQWNGAQRYLTANCCCSNRAADLKTKRNNFFFISFLAFLSVTSAMSFLLACVHGRVRCKTMRNMLWWLTSHYLVLPALPVTRNKYRMLAVEAAMHSKRSSAILATTLHFSFKLQSRWVTSRLCILLRYL